MSKRFIYHNQFSDRKKPKLDVSISDHNFPLSQNAGNSNQDVQQDNWGDDNDDEILLLASQACENDISTLPDYTFCMNPGSTSTQIFASQPSTSNFTFKKPTTTIPTAVSSHLKDKCTRISSPLPGISAKTMKEQINLTDDLILNDKVFKSQDQEYVYRQLLQLQEENAKIKSENGKLLEKCVTKEGEASILRTQLKTCQGAIDSARMEKIKAQERIQMEWTEKLTVANKHMQELRTQLDFKNLEIISTKEKCKMLESSKIKLTQVTLPHNDINTSYRNNTQLNENQSQFRRTKVRHCSSGVQTDDKPAIFTLNRTLRNEKSNLQCILPHLVNLSTENQTSLIEYNEKLQKPTDFTQNKCRIFSTFHRIPSTPLVTEKKRRLSMDAVYGDIVCLVSGKGDGNFDEKVLNILTTVKECLRQVLNDLQNVFSRMTTAFQRDMDEKYIEASSAYVAISDIDLFKNEPLFKEEQSVLPRRLTAIIAYLLKYSSNCSVTAAIVKYCTSNPAGDSCIVIDDIGRICSFLDSTFCAVLYSGLILSLTALIEELTKHNSISTQTLTNIIQTIITSRPLPTVSCTILRLISKMENKKDILSEMCCKNANGNLKTDFDQGVLLYKKETCHLQILLKQIESSLKCILKQHLVSEAIDVASSLLHLCGAVFIDYTERDNTRCECNLIWNQVLVYSLYICAVQLNHSTNLETSDLRKLHAISRLGVSELYVRMSNDISTSSRLGHNEGHYHVFLELCQRLERVAGIDDVYVTMLTELVSALQPSTDEQDMPSAANQQAWIQSFQQFSVND